MQKSYDTMADIVSEVMPILKPPERLSVSEAANKYRKINNVGSYVGKWKNDTVPYMVEPMDTLGSREYNALIFGGPAQCGKTDSLFPNWLLHNIIGDGADMIFYQTSQAVARSYSKMKIDRLHRDTKKIGDMLMNTSDADNTHDKKYKNGAILSLSWPTINEMSGKAVGLVGLSDYDRMPLSVDMNGSPFDLARGRTTTFGDFAMTMAESSPGYSVSDLNKIAKHPHEAPAAPGIAALYNRGDMRRWYWPCNSCGNFYEPRFKYLTWVDSDDVQECAESAMMQCPLCKEGLMHHDDKYEINKAGVWLKKGESINKDGVKSGVANKNDIASFWLYGVAAAFSSWESLVRKYIKAEQEYERTGDQESLKVTVNTDQGDVYYARGSGLSRTPEELKDKSVDFGSLEPVVPQGVAFIIGTVDVQARKFVVQVQGIIPAKNSALSHDIVVIDRFDVTKSDRRDNEGDRLELDPSSYIEDWHLLKEKVICRSYMLGDGSGRRMFMKMTACDSGGKSGVTPTAYKFWSYLKSEGLAGKFMLVKGHSRAGAPRAKISYPDNDIKGVPPELTGTVPVLMLQSNKLKDELDSSLNRKEAGGMIVFSHLLPDNFYSELTVEMRMPCGKWENPKKLNNESMDLLYYCIGVCYYLRVGFINWSDPVGWAKCWDENDLVVDKESDNKFIPTKKNDYDAIRRMGDMLND